MNNVSEIKQYIQQLRNPKTSILTKAKFGENSLAPLLKEVGFFLCKDSIYHRCVFFKPCKSFEFKVNNKSMIWHYKRYFNCDSKNVIYILMYNTSKWFYLGPDKLPIQSREIESINQMFFIPRIVFVRNNQNIYTIVVE